MADLGTEPRLVVPEGLVIDESVRKRLERRLASEPDTVVGVAAETSDLAPGESYRVHVEWKALESAPATPLDPSTAVRGAALLRAGVAYDVRDGRVTIAATGIPGALVLVDPAAPVLDPHAPAGPLEDAVERGRTPFPLRPVVVFLGCEPVAAADADWVRRLVNRLVRRGIEARIALPAAPPGFHRTRPCLPTAASIRALAPDVIVTLDATAAARSDEWPDVKRSAVVVAFDRELSDPMELVSWQIARAQGRLRARIGPHVDVTAFVPLLLRLCAGPQPAPPSDDKILVDSRRPVREGWTHAAASDAAPECVVLTGALAADDAARVNGLVDNLSGAGASITRAASTGEVPAAARHAAVVLLAGVERTDELDALITDRARAGRATVLALFRADLVAGTSCLKETTVAMARLCGRVVTPAGAVHTAARAIGVRTLMIPTLFTREHAATLRAARVSFAPDPTAARIIGWQLGEPVPHYAGAVAAGIELALVHDTNECEFVGDPALLPPDLAAHERVRVVPEPDLDAVARWAVHAFTPAVVDGEIAGATQLFELVSYLGVPSVLPEMVALAVEGVFSPFVLVDPAEHAEAWGDALHHVLDDNVRRAQRAREALNRADALDSPATANTVANRFLGWATYRTERRAAVSA
jgi:hypothetical protein